MRYAIPAPRSAEHETDADLPGGEKWRTRLEFFVGDPGEIPHIRQVVRAALGGIERANNAELAASEMATNVLDHAKEGWLIVAVSASGRLACVMTVDYNTDPDKLAKATSRLVGGAQETEDHLPLFLEDDGAIKPTEELNIDEIDFEALLDRQRGLPLVRNLAELDEMGAPMVGVQATTRDKTLWACVPLPAPADLHEGLERVA